MDRPFRFGVHLWNLPDDWPAAVRRYEELGFSTITFTDHVAVPQLDPLVALASITAATSTLRGGSLVLDMGLRNPVLVAKAAASLHSLSRGRFELGLGAGYVKRNFEMAGLPWMPAAARIDRLASSIDIIRSVWTNEVTSVSDDSFTIEGAARSLPEPVDLPILVGGGGPKVLAVAGRSADIVSLIPRQPSGDWNPGASLEDSTDDALAEKVRWVHEAAAGAGREPDQIELNTMVFRTAIADDPAPGRRQIAELDGAPPEGVVDSSLYLTGTPDEVRSRLLHRRARFGLSYYSIFDPAGDQLEVIATELISQLDRP
jgi:probable F420-dependent oxidoreductase